MQQHVRLGPGLATLFVAGSMIGSGVYLLPASLAVLGSISILGWFCAIAFSLIFAAVFARLAIWRGDPISQSVDGNGFIGRIGEAFGRPTAFVAAVFYWVQGVLGNVALALATTGYLAAVFPLLGGTISATVCTIAIMWLFTLIGLFGPALVARLEGWTLALGLAPVLIATTLGWLWFDPAIFRASWNVSGQPVLFVVPQATVLALWAFLGLESAALAANMVRDPERTVPRATICGVLLAALLYLSACTALTGLLPAAALAKSSAPFADATGRLFGAGFGLAVALCAALKASGTLGGWILLTAESARLAGEVRRGHAPHDARPSAANILANGCLLTVVAILIANPSIAEQFTQIINAAVVVMLCVYAIAGAALIRLHWRRAEVPARWSALALGTGAIVISSAVVAGQGTTNLAITAALLTLAVSAWHLLGWRQRRL